MLTRGDITDALYERLFAAAGPSAPAGPGKARASKRVFLSDYEIKKLMAPGAKVLKVPANAIISPLSMDWIEYNGVRVVRE